MSARRLARLGLLLALCGAAAGCAPGGCGGWRGSPRYDLLVRGGSLVDGTGAPARRADVAVCGDRIAGVGRLEGARAVDTLDATGLVVAPGFIDMLGHSEYLLLRDGRAVSKVTQGITSEITGEVTSVVPVNENTLRGLPRWMRERTSWTGLDGYFEALERSGTAINLGTFVTVGSVRAHVMGDATRAPTPAELERMRRLVAEAMEQGSMGVSAALAYPPASAASEDEVVQLVRAAAEHGGGYATHLRSEGDSLVESVREAIRIGERAGTWVHVHHLKAAGHHNWGKVDAAVREIEAARARGTTVTADYYPYTASSTGLDAALPAWARAGGTDSLLARLRDPAARERIRAQLAERWTGWRGGAEAAGPRSVVISGVGQDTLLKYVGMRLSGIADARGRDVESTLMDLVLADGGRTSATFFSMSERDLETVMRQPWAGVGSDAGARAAASNGRDLPHPRTYGTFPRVLCRYVRERGTLSLEQAVRSFTAVPAAAVGLAGRGVVRTGAYADLAVFDPRTTCDRATFQRPLRLSRGVRHVLVNGRPVLRDGRLTGARPGRALRPDRRAPSP